MKRTTRNVLLGMAFGAFCAGAILIAFFGLFLLEYTHGSWLSFRPLPWLMGLVFLLGLGISLLASEWREEDPAQPRGGFGAEE